MDKTCTYQDVLAKIGDGQTLMIGGFLGTGTPEKLIDAILEKKAKNLTVIANDTAFPDKGIGRLVVEKLLKKVIVSHIGTNPETGRQMNAGEMEVELVPQGSLAEKIRCGGGGLGGVLTPTGVGTIVDKGKQQMQIDGRTYLLELPLKADIALVKAAKADKSGNLIFNKAARNFNPLMPLAASLVIVEAEEIVEIGALDPDEVMLPGLAVDMILKG